jgi:hypothetical protein
MKCMVSLLHDTFRAAIVRHPWAENKGTLPEVPIPIIIGLNHNTVHLTMKKVCDCVRRIYYSL